MDNSQLTSAMTAGSSNDSSATNISEEFIYVYDMPEDEDIPLNEALPLFVTYSLTLLLGLIGNLLVIFSVAYYRRMRTTTNVFLFSLATADLLLVLICVPVKAAGFMSFTWTFGEVLCKLVHYVQNVSMICSVLTLTCISLERVVAVVSPLKARTVCTMRHAKIVVVLVWILSFVCALPTIFVQTHREVGVLFKGYWCMKIFSSFHLHLIYETYMMILLFVLPMVIMVSTYFCICLKVWKFTDMRTEMRHGRVIAPITKDRTRQDNSGVDSVPLQLAMDGDARTVRAGRKRETALDDSRATKQLVIMLVVVVVLFALCWGPVVIDNLLVASGVLESLHYGFLLPMRKSFNLLCYLNSCINPIVYAFMSKNFRQSFKYAICACVKGKAFIRAYRFSMSITHSTRTSIVSNGKFRHEVSANRDKSSSSGNEYTQVVTSPDEEVMELQSVGQ